MKNPKRHDKFKTIDMKTSWETPVGYPQGIHRKIPAGSLDEKGKSGNRSRLLRFAPGVHATKPFVPDYWEEVFLLSGNLIVGNDEHGKGGESLEPLTYACRPPGAHHGPFKSVGGCLFFEIHYV